MTTVLLVDDDEISNREVRKSLKSIGCAVVEVSALGDAVRAVQAERPDLVIMDLFLPERAGLLLLRNLHQEYPNMGIIAMTGESGITKIDYHRLAMDCGAHGVLTKPFPRIDLISMANDVLGEL